VRQPTRALTLILLLVPAAAFADEVYLKGGGQVTGQIVERSDIAVKVDVGAGVVSVPMSSVAHIETGSSPLHQYRDRAAAIAPGDAAAWRDLGRWAQGQSLATQAREAYTKALAIDPNDAVANRGLGRVQLDGRWVREEEAYRAQGYIEFEREWMTPAERDLILQERQARDAADQQQFDQHMEALAASDKAKAEEEARRKAEWDQAWPMLGDPVFRYW
jgi:hypothetical protein